MQRNDLIQLLTAALAHQHAAYAQRLAQSYLRDCPHDLPMQWVLAQALAQQNDTAGAIAVLENITQADPECFPAHRLLGEQLLKTPRLNQAALALACAYVGDGQPTPPGLRLPEWTSHLRQAYLALQKGDATTARPLIQAALSQRPVPALAAVLHVCADWHSGNLAAARPQAEAYLAEWPQVVGFKLCVAESLLKANDYPRGLRLLHTAAAQDPAGQVAARHWGQAHPYTALWPNAPQFELTAPLPASLLQALGLNRLTGTVVAPSAPAPEPAPFTPSEPEATAASADMQNLQAELDDLAERLTGKRLTPCWYVVVSARQPLLRKFGPEGLAVIEQALRELLDSLAQVHQLTGALLYVDDAASLRPFNLEPVEASNAWAIKLLLQQWRAACRQRGDDLAALLLVGNADVIPFHHLPNPTDDADADIPSDNPYAADDDNYFTPGWPLSRLPLGADQSATDVAHILKQWAAEHRTLRPAPPEPWLLRLFRWLARLFERPITAALVAESFGYSAHVWHSAARAVYATIGTPDDLLTCPPLDTQQLGALAPARLSYFNLHGLEDSPEWYGQRAPDDPSHLPEYPVALRPSDVTNSGHAPRLVFSAACYGANVVRKTVAEALCLRFLQCGTWAVVGSTKIAYGAVSTPLLGADLLGRLFWQNITEGLTASEALQKAKTQFIGDMHARQGYLDAEDQKTLLSFVLYGDPLARLTRTPMPSAHRAKHRVNAAPAPRPSATDQTLSPAHLSAEQVTELKQWVSRYLPAMRNADVVSAQTRGFTPRAAKAARPATRTVVTLSKTIRTNTRAHPHYARLTLDAQGNVIKLAVSH